MKPTLLIIALLSSLIITSQSIKSPSDFLGYELGSNFSRHHQITDYYQYLAETYPDKIKLEEYGRTYEGRKLLLAFISSEENINNLEKLRKTHLNTAKGNDLSNKAIVWLSYNVHGNEAVSSEASMLTSYELLTKKQEWLKNTIVIIDPCINPDGRDRYVNWYNQYKNSPHNIDPQSKEHHEGWLTGRPNHYMFDLNRDWAWITQKESQQRLKIYNKWLPHIHVDFHEQGVDAPYYFAPAAEPLHEVITDWQKEFQTTIGKNHAKYFDEKGWLYFTKEIFDLLYPSYGDTYPTYNGAIGMTYEQGGSGRAGLGIINNNGDTLTLKDRIAHHNTTGLSTVEISSLNKKKLIKEFKNFYLNQSFKYKSYLMSGDKGKIQLLTDLLDAHEIAYGYVNTSQNVKGYDFSEGKNGSMKAKENDLVVSTNQLKGTLVKVLFEPITKLSDSLTYDITAWSLPYAYGLNAIASENYIPSTTKDNNFFASKISFTAENYAYIGKWKSMNDARFLAELIKNKIRVRYTTEPFNLKGDSYDRGSLIITTADNKYHPDFLSLLKTISNKHKKDLSVTKTGFVDSGKDFGSNAVKMISNKKIGIFSGTPFSTLNFGEVWHYFEQQLKYPVSIVDLSYFNQIYLSEYDILILPETKENINENILKTIKNWVTNGGKLIAIGSSINALINDNDFGINPKNIDKNNNNEDNSMELAPFSGNERDYIKGMITGAIFKAKVDKTHPMSYGFGDNYFTLKLNNSAYKFLNEGNAVYINEKQKPYNGFAGSEAINKQKNTVIFGSNQLGKGQVVIMVDNPLFRGFWESGKLFMANSVFFVGN